MAAVPPPRSPLGSQAVIDAAGDADWRPLDPARTLYMDVAGGQVVIELAPAFAPAHVANIKTLVAQRFFDGLSVNRVQDNYVAQWGDASEAKSLGAARSTLPLEAERAAGGLAFAPLPHRDAYAAQVGFVDGFAVARDPATGRAWLAHCYGVVGVGRGDAADSGSGAELFAVIGHAPRHLDRNYAPIGRVVAGIERLSALPRGTGALGFYERPEQRVTVTRVRLGSDLPKEQRLPIEIMRTDTPAFAAYVEARANRARDGFLVSAGGVDLCAIRVPSRPATR